MSIFDFTKRACARLLRPGGLALTLLLCKRWMFENVLIHAIPSAWYFRLIYKYNYWLDPESRSGPGSSSAQTVQIRRALPYLFDKYDISSVIDAPCGDFSWMKEVVTSTNIIYRGIDIVPGIIERNRRLHGAPGIIFSCQDIATTPMPLGDLWICRDLLFHLDNRTIANIFRRFLESQVGFFLVTSHLASDVQLPGLNSEIKTGGYRPLNLLAPPFSLPEQCLYRFDDYVRPQMPREMRLYAKEQVEKPMKSFCLLNQ